LQSINKENIIIIINASGTLLDISQYLNEDINNVIVNKPPNRKINSKCVFYENNYVDTLINITSTELSETLQYIKKRL
jgi:hypothetical protein